MVDKRIRKAAFFLYCADLAEKNGAPPDKIHALRGEAAKLTIAAKESHLRKKLNLTR